MHETHVKSESWRTSLHPIFAACTSKEDSRYALSQPWLADDGYVYATDGVICMRQKHTPDVGELPKPNGTPPNAVSLNWDDQYNDEPLVIPDLGDGPERPKCDYCKGEGSVKAWDKRRKEYEVTCPECDGTGKDDPLWRFIDWDGYALNEKYLRPLIDHKAKIYRPQKDSNPARFEIEGGIEGLLMRCDITSIPKNLVIRVEGGKA